MKNTDHNILLVEDDPDDVLMIMEALGGNTSPLTIVHKKNGLEALNYLNEVKVKAFLPSLIIMDINMPVLNGRQLLSIIKKGDEFRAIPIIVFTTSSNEEDKEFCNQFNVRMVTKPNSLEAFYKKVQDFIKSNTA